jgi:thioredoxin-related protein
MIKRIVVWFLLFGAVAFSAPGNVCSYDQVSWANSYEEALEEAKILDKRVMVLITTQQCKWCKRLKKKTLRNKKLVERINDQYVSVQVTRDVDKYPKFLRAKVVPSTHLWMMLIVVLII